MGGLSTLSTPYLGRSHARFNHDRSICSIHSQPLGLKESGQVCAPFPVQPSPSGTHIPETGLGGINPPRQPLR